MPTIYIAPTGNDTTGDGSVGNPYLSPSQAITVASNGDTIMAAAGAYPGTVEFGNITKEVSILGPNAGISPNAANIVDPNPLRVAEAIFEKGGKYYADNITIDGCMFDTNTSPARYFEIVPYNVGNTINNASFVNNIVNNAKVFHINSGQTSISAFADAGGGNVTVTCPNSPGGITNGSTVEIAGTTNYDGTYAISNFSGGDPFSFDIVATFAGTETGLLNATWTINDFSFDDNRFTGLDTYTIGDWIVQFSGQAPYIQNASIKRNYCDQRIRDDDQDGYQGFNLHSIQNSSVQYNYMIGGGNNFACFGDGIKNVTCEYNTVVDPLFFGSFRVGYAAITPGENIIWRYNTLNIDNSKIIRYGPWGSFSGWTMYSRDCATLIIENNTFNVTGAFPATYSDTSPGKFDRQCILIYGDDNVLTSIRNNTITCDAAGRDSAIDDAANEFSGICGVEIFSDSGAYGLISGTILIQGNSFKYCTNAVSIFDLNGLAYGNLDNPNIVLRENYFDTSCTYGVRSDTSTENTDAKQNNWGDFTGPSGGVADPLTSTLADGHGCQVTTFVLFDPYKEVPYDASEASNIPGLTADTVFGIGQNASKFSDGGIQSITAANNAGRNRGPLVYIGGVAGGVTPNRAHLGIGGSQGGMGYKYDK